MFKPTYDEKNRERLEQLAPNTKVAALKWYEFCVQNEIDVLITQTLRTLEEQKRYLAEGRSKTLRSYHLVGQALDFVPVVNGKVDYNLYQKEPFLGAIGYAKQVGFEWGGDWKGFVDMPLLQFNYKGYGSDKDPIVCIPKPIETKKKSVEKKAEKKVEKALFRRELILGFK